MNWLISGDCHGKVAERLDNIAAVGYVPKETNVILLGDVSLNFWLNKSDINNKKRTNAKGFNIWCIRGNHEQRSSLIPNIQWVYNEEVKGIIGVEPEFPNIHYFKDDISEYTINGYKCLIIPGAFSIDKEYRCQRTRSNGWCGWFPDEQLSPQEMEAGMKLCSGKTYDFILSHTCPICWEPYDLFLSFIDQSKVDKSMEIFLNDLKDKVHWSYWLFGHYHQDRYERPHVEQFFEHFDTLEAVAARWKHWDKTGTLENYYVAKSPMFYAEES